MPPDVSEQTPISTQRTHGINTGEGGEPAINLPLRTGFHFELDLPLYPAHRGKSFEEHGSGYLRFQSIETRIKRPQLSEGTQGAGVDEAVEKPYGIHHQPHLNPFVGRVFKSGTLTEHPHLHRHSRHAHNCSS